MLTIFRLDENEPQQQQQQQVVHDIPPNRPKYNASPKVVPTSRLPSSTLPKPSNGLQPSPSSERLIPRPTPTKSTQSTNSTSSSGSSSKNIKQGSRLRKPSQIPGKAALPQIVQETKKQPDRKKSALSLASNNQTKPAVVEVKAADDDKDYEKKIEQLQMELEKEKSIVHVLQGQKEGIY